MCKNQPQPHCFQHATAVSKRMAACGTMWHNPAEHRVPRRGGRINHLRNGSFAHFRRAFRGTARVLERDRRVFGKGVRTVVRWEKAEGLPVHRHLHERRSSVFAYKSEIDAWWQSRRSVLDGEASQPQSVAPPPVRAHWLKLAALIPLAGLVIWVVHSATVWRSEPFLNFQPLTSYPGGQFQPSFSPDGSHFAFAWNGGTEDHTSLYVQAVGSAEPKRLTAHISPDFSPAWSPDGKVIAFLRRLAHQQIALLLSTLARRC